MVGEPGRGVEPVAELGVGGGPRHLRSYEAWVVIVRRDLVADLARERLQRRSPYSQLPRVLMPPESEGFSLPGHSSRQQRQAEAIRADDANRSLNRTGYGIRRPQLKIPESSKPRCELPHDCVTTFAPSWKRFRVARSVA